MKSIAAMLLLCASGLCWPALAQAPKSETPTLQRARGYDPLVAWAMIWGDPARVGVYTCEEWKRYATRLFKEADKNHDGFVDEREFKSIQQADPMLKSSDLAYFDDNRDGRLSLAEFVDKPNPFFVRYDRKQSCRVSVDDLVEASVPEKKAR